MPLYHLEAAAVEFRAESLTDAFDKLAHHFLSIALELPTDLLTRGEIRVVRIEEEDE